MIFIRNDVTKGIKGTCIKICMSENGEKIFLSNLISVKTEDKNSYLHLCICDPV